MGVIHEKPLLKYSTVTGRRRLAFRSLIISEANLRLWDM